MSTLTIWKFERADGADRAGAALRGPAGRRIGVEDAATVSWPPDRERPRTHQVHGLTTAGGLDGAFWGLVFGIVFFVPLGELRVDIGLDDALVTSVRAEIAPSTSVLFLRSRGAAADRVQEAFEGVGAQLISTARTPEQAAPPPGDDAG